MLVSLLFVGVVGAVVLLFDPSTDQASVGSPFMDGSDSAAFGGLSHASEFDSQLSGVLVDLLRVTLTPVSQAIDQTTKYVLPHSLRWANVTSPTHWPTLTECVFWSIVFAPLWLILDSVIVYLMARLRLAEGFDELMYEKFRSGYVSIAKKTIMLAVTTVVLLCKDWSTDPHALWRDFPNHRFGIDMKALYFLNISWYFQQTGNHLFSPHLRNRSDHKMMMFHHLITASLFLMSYAGNYLRIGLLVIYVHEIGDWLLATLKMFIYYGYHNVPTIGMGPMMITWIVTRMWGFPVYLIMPIYDPGMVIVDKKHHLYMHTGAIMLWSLVPLHYYWFSLLVNATIKKIFYGKTIQDSRESDTVMKEDGTSGSIESVKAKKHD
jgi:hypothetical protein